MKKFSFPLLIFFELLALIGAFFTFFTRIKLIEPVHWIAACVTPGFELQVWGCVPVVALVLTFLIFFKIRNEMFLRGLAIGGLPLLLLAAQIFIMPDFYTIIPVVLIVIWSVYRIFCRCEIVLPEWLNHSKLAWGIVCAGACIGAVYGVFMQFDAMNRLLLSFSDWSVYVLAYKKLGNVLFSDPLQFLAVGGHFNLLPNLIGALLFQFAQEPTAIFYLNSIIIYSTVPCAFFAARSKGLSPSFSLVISCSLLLGFSLANLNLCVFYGYHPNVCFLPLFLLFYGFYERKNYKKALIFLILSLLVQETFAVLWFGFGAMLCVFERKKKQRWGIALMILMVLWFLLITQVVMPLSGPVDDARYGQLFHYSNLGNTIPEILLSPILKPKVFFRELFSVENFYFAGMLITSSIGCLFAPRWLLAVLPSFAGVCLLNGTELSNVAMQYQVEFFAILTAAVIAGTAVAGQRSAACKTAICAATVVGTILCAFFIGRQPWGFYSYFNEMTRGNHKERIVQLKQMIPPGKKLQTVLGYQAHFMCRNELSGFENKKVDLQADYILLPTTDNFSSQKELEELFFLIVRSRKFRILAHEPESSNGFILFCRNN